MCGPVGLMVVASARVVLMISQLGVDLGLKVELGNVHHGCYIWEARQIAAFWQSLWRGCGEEVQRDSVPQNNLGICDQG